MYSSKYWLSEDPLNGMNLSPLKGLELLLDLYAQSLLVLVASLMRVLLTLLKMRGLEVVLMWKVAKDDPEFNTLPPFEDEI